MRLNTGFAKLGSTDAPDLADRITQPFVIFLCLI